MLPQRTAGDAPNFAHLPGGARRPLKCPKAPIPPKIDSASVENSGLLAAEDLGKAKLSNKLSSIPNAFDSNKA